MLDAIAAVFDALTVTPNDLAELVPQLLVAVTVIFPFWLLFPEVTVIEVVP